MPHFILDLNERLLTVHPPATLMRIVHDTADATGLFAKGDIKVRIRPYVHGTVGNAQQDFIHVFAYIMEGRTTEQKSALSRSIVRELMALYPDAPVISMNVMEFERATYANRKSV